MVEKVFQKSHSNPDPFPIILVYRSFTLWFKVKNDQILVQLLLHCIEYLSTLVLVKWVFSAWVKNEKKTFFLKKN